MIFNQSKLRRRVGTPFRVSADFDGISRCGHSGHVNLRNLEAKKHPLSPTLSPIPRPTRSTFVGRLEGKGENHYQTRTIPLPSECKTKFCRVGEGVRGWRAAIARPYRLLLCLMMLVLSVTAAAAQDTDAVTDDLVNLDHLKFLTQPV